MRTELERIQLIEKHLLKTLTAEEKVIFQKEVKANPNFEVEIQTQKELMEGVKKLAFKDTATKSYKKYKGIKKLWKWGVGGALSILVLAVAIPLALNLEESKEGSSEVEMDCTISDVSTQTNFDALADQTYFINTKKDTVIETDEGIVFAIPANAFVDENGKEVNGNVRLMVKEALTPDQIIVSGLSTTSNGGLLETGGMFFIDAFSDGKKLTLVKEIIAEVPTDEMKEGMQLFDGERMADGQINWVNPKPLENYLTPVDILSLNFYPPGYENKLADLGHGGRSKAWKDSVYYSFAVGVSEESNTEGQEGVELIDEVDITEERRMVSAESLVIDSTSVVSKDSMAIDKFETGVDESVSQQVNELAINPIKIQAIWDKKFNNTNLATKKFEERMQVIFSSCNHEVFELYVNNLDKELWVVDSMVALIAPIHLKQKFTEFKNRKDGKVKAEDKLLKRLSKYYIKKQKRHLKAVQKLQKKYWEKQQKAATKFARTSIKKDSDEYQRKHKNLENEFNKNLREVNKQLSVKPLRYKVKIHGLGQKNIDKYVKDEYYNQVMVPTLNSTVNRQSTTIKYKGKTAKITYTPFFVSVENKEEYDRIYCYLLSDELYSFQRMKDTTGGFYEKLNGFLKYNLVIIAYKGDSCFLFKKQGLNEGDELVASLNYVKQKRLKKELSLLGRNSTKSFKKDVMDDLKFEKLKVKEGKRKIAAKVMRAFRNELEKVVFPCKREVLDKKEECIWEMIHETDTLRLNDKNNSLTLYYVHDKKSIVQNYSRLDRWKFNSTKTSLLFSSRFNSSTASVPIRWGESLTQFTATFRVEDDVGIKEYVKYFYKKCGDIGIYE